MEIEIDKSFNDTGKITGKVMEQVRKFMFDEYGIALPNDEPQETGARLACKIWDAIWDAQHEKTEGA